ncbi:TlpA family protein disulfide reductase [Aestuariibaculum suncheonense]|uniref:TlpA family protein disulfide reductase n=2 Tax=Aestuariibaculum suncheonense TaxID=1028745 RepID=A0A8J6Q8E1_9FLAO|nr:TlpA family protein disulfide reductase [Aestuariibaculum suncheonense]
MGGDKKVIEISEDGTFIDTFKVRQGKTKLQMMLEKDHKMCTLFAENGSNIHFEADGSDFLSTLKFTEDLADINNYERDKMMIMTSDQGFNRKIWYRFDQETFDSKISTLRQALITSLESYSNIPQEQLEEEKSFIDKYLERLVSKYDSEHAYASKLEKGNPSPAFENYENYDGSTTSLSDFKGKYVFIDVWATWCSPCKAEIPFLEALEKEYHGENIVFVSMSVDKQADKEKWRNMVKDKAMSGVQILAPNATGSEFTRAYNINAIPRFILIDPQGNIVDFNAPRPSNKEEIHKLLDVVKS